MLNDYGKLPPQAIELEEAILSALLIEKSAFESVSEIISPRSFYKDSNSLIYSAISKLASSGSPIDSLTVVNQLKRDGNLEACGGAYGIAELSRKISSAANIEFHAKIVQQKFIQREVIRITSEAQKEAFNDTSDCYEVIDSLEKSIANIQHSSFESKSWSEQIKEATEYVEKIDRESGVSGIPSGMKSIDSVLKGFQNGELIILGARPAMGKSAWLVSVAINVARLGIPVDIYSLEMAGLQLILRAISFESRVDGDTLKSGKLHDQDWLRINNAAHELSKLPVHLDDLPSQKPQSIRRKIKKGVKERGTRIVFIDYLQLMDASDEAGKANRDTQIGEISRTLKRIAKECNIPVIALASLNRSVEQRGGTKKPMMSDLRESGNIESDADVVSFLYRPEYYGFTQDESGNSLIGVAEFIIAKNRNGATDTCLIRFDGARSSFTDISISDFFVGEHRHFAEPPEKDETPF